MDEPRTTRFFEHKLQDFEKILHSQWGLATSTIEVRSRHVSGFFKWISKRNVALRSVSVGHVERYLDGQKAKGWALPTLAITAYSLQKFFLHAEGRGWVRRGLSFGVPTYAIPRHAFVPKGPCWKDVQRMIASLDDERPVELRDHAMLRLMAVYGLRGGDLIALHLSDVDFAERILTVHRRKNMVTQRFPLNRDTVRTLRRYVNSARPVSQCPAFFTTFVAPYEPLRARHGLYAGTQVVHQEWRHLVIGHHRPAFCNAESDFEILSSLTQLLVATTAHTSRFLLSRSMSSFCTGREIPSFFILAIKVVRFSPNWAAAPFGPPINPPCRLQGSQNQGSRRTVEGAL